MKTVTLPANDDDLRKPCSLPDKDEDMALLNRAVTKKVKNLYFNAPPNLLEDAVGDVMLAWLKTRDRRESRGVAHLPWLLGIAGNVGKNLGIKLKNYKGKFASLAVLPPKYEPVTGPDQESDLLDTELSRMNRDMIARLVSVLTNQEHEVIRRRYFDENSIEEIAEALFVKEDYVYVLHYRALNKMRKQAKKLGERR